MDEKEFIKAAGEMENTKDSQADEKSAEEQKAQESESSKSQDKEDVLDALLEDEEQEEAQDKEDKDEYVKKLEKRLKQAEHKIVELKKKFKSQEKSSDEESDFEDDFDFEEDNKKKSSSKEVDIETLKETLKEELLQEVAAYSMASEIEEQLKSIENSKLRKAVEHKLDLINLDAVADPKEAVETAKRLVQVELMEKAERKGVPLEKVKEVLLSDAPSGGAEIKQKEDVLDEAILKPFERYGFKPE